MQNKKRNYILISIVISILFTIYLPSIIQISNYIGYSNSFIAFFLAIINSFVIYHIISTHKWCSIKKYIYEIFLAIFISVSLVLGKQLDTEMFVDFLNINTWISILIMSIYFFIIVVKGFELLDCNIIRKNIIIVKSMKYEKLFIWLSLILVWIPVILAFYPGAFLYDSNNEFHQISTREFTTHHPLLHILALGIPVLFGNKYLDSYNIGIFIFVAIQMIILSACFTYVISYMKKKGISKIIRIITFLWFGFFPVIQMYVVCTTKDVLFTAALLIHCIQLLEYDYDKENYFSNKKNIILFILSAVVMLLLRNNILYAYIVMIVIFSLYCILKKSNKKLIFSMMISLVIAILLNNIMIFALDASKGKKQEILTVPIQQLARTYKFNENSFTEEQKNTLYEILSEEALDIYSPNISDLIKVEFNNENYLNAPSKYNKLWFEIGVNNPFTYVNAWLLTSYGFWYPDTIINVYEGTQRFTYIYEDSSFFGFETELPGIRDSKLPILEEFYRKISLELYQQKVPVLSMLFSLGFYTYIYLFFGLYICKKNKGNYCKPLFLILLLFATFLLGPTYLIRYMLIYWFFLPVLFIPILNKNYIE